MLVLLDDTSNCVITRKQLSNMLACANQSSRQRFVRHQQRTAAGAPNKAASDEPEGGNWDGEGSGGGRWGGRGWGGEEVRQLSPHACKLTCKLPSRHHASHLNHSCVTACTAVTAAQ